MSVVDKEYCTVVLKEIINNLDGVENKPVREVERRSHLILEDEASRTRNGISNLRRHFIMVEIICASQSKPKLLSLPLKSC